MEDQSKKTLIVAAVASAASVALTYFTLNKVNTEPEKVKEQMEDTIAD